VILRGIAIFAGQIRAWTTIKLVVRDIDIIDSELRLVAALRSVARERGGPLPSIAVADALLDERSELTGLPGLTSCLGSY
jgi:hypothetical protein